MRARLCLSACDGSLYVSAYVKMSRREREVCVLLDARTNTHKHTYAYTPRYIYAVFIGGWSSALKVRNTAVMLRRVPQPTAGRRHCLANDVLT